MRHIKKVSIFLFLLSGCTMGDYIPPLLSGDIYRLGSKICAKSNDGNIISDYVLFEGVQGDKIKMVEVAGKNNFVCIDSEGLLENVTYIGHYVTINNNKKEYYGFNVKKIDGRIYRVDDGGKYIPLI